MNDFNAEIITNDLMDWLKYYFTSNGDENTIAVIGMSGGKDSLIAAALCAKVLGPERVLGVMMPNGEQADKDDASAAIDYLGIDGIEVNIKSICDAEYEVLENLGMEITPAIKTNVPARVRMMTLYSIAADAHGRVVCTSNRSERYVGYSTKWGDGVGDLMPFGDLTVTELYAIGDYLELPKHLLYKAPADGMTGKTDEEVLGFTYKELDNYILKHELPEDVEIFRKIKQKHHLSLHKTNNIPSYYKKLPGSVGYF